ncbi:MAG: PEP-CTERM sorting domain-containing protein [Cytophagales bacterium]|nr:PEP-CTERM sorting domain-containing protein [Rhizobacter sp.]
MDIEGSLVNSNACRLPLLLSMLCATPLMAMTNNHVANNRFESVVHPTQTWLGQASFGEHDAARGKRMSQEFGSLLVGGNTPSFASSAGERMTGAPGGGGDFPLGGTFTHAGVSSDAVWPADFLSEGKSWSSVTGITTPVPEPQTYVLMLLGLITTAFLMRHRNRS